MDKDYEIITECEEEMGIVDDAADLINEEEINAEITKAIKELKKEGKGEEDLLSDLDFSDMDSIDSLGIYFRQIGSIPLLSASEERELAAKMTAGDMAAKKELIERNLRLAAAFAKKYQNRGLDLPDLLQDATMGLISGISHFDYTKGFKLSTYCSYWIRQALTRSLADKARIIRLPVHLIDKVGKVQRMQKQLSLDLGHEPSVSELAQATGLSTAKVTELLSYAQDTVSLNAPAGEDDAEREDFIADKETPSLEQQAERQALVEACHKAMSSKLTEREQKVLSLRFGFEGEEMTLDQVGKILVPAVTRERVRQIERRAIQKLRTPSTAKLLQDFYDGRVISA